MIEVPPDLSDVKLRRSPVLPILLLLLLAGAGAGAFYYMKYVKQQAVAATADAGPAAPVIPPVGTVQVSSRPEGAAVWLRLGRTPLTAAAIDPARSHLVRVEHDGYQARDVLVEPGQGEVDVALEPNSGAAPDEPTALPGAPPSAPGGAVPTGRLRVTSNPPAASAWLLVAVSPGTIGPLATGGPIDLRIAKTGHLPIFVNVPRDSFNRAGEARLSRDLTPRPP
jgi:hypothetical protein